MTANSADQGATPTDTVDALLRAGRALFAERGYDGTSVRAITTAAGANLGSMTYHFGSKEAFYERVVEATVRPFVSRVEATAAGPGRPLERVGEVVRTYFDHLSATPELPPFMLQALWRRAGPPGAVRELIGRLHRALIGLIREGQADGSIRPGNAAVMAISIASNPVHLALVQRPLKAFLGIDLSEAAARAEVVENAVRFVRAGLAAGGEGGDG